MCNLQFNSTHVFVNPAYLIVDGDLRDLCFVFLCAGLECADQGVHGGAGDKGPNYPPTLLQPHPDNLMDESMNK